MAAAPRTITSDFEAHRVQQERAAVARDERRRKATEAEALAQCQLRKLENINVPPAVPDPPAAGNETNYQNTGPEGTSGIKIEVSIGADVRRLVDEVNWQRQHLQVLREQVNESRRLEASLRDQLAISAEDLDYAVWETRYEEQQKLRHHMKDLQDRLREAHSTIQTRNRELSKSEEKLGVTEKQLSEAQGAERAAQSQATLDKEYAEMTKTTAQKHLEALAEAAAEASQREEEKQQQHLRQVQELQDKIEEMKRSSERERENAQSRPAAGAYPAKPSFAEESTSEHSPDGGGTRPIYFPVLKVRCGRSMTYEYYRVRGTGQRGYRCRRNGVEITFDAR